MSQSWERLLLVAFALYVSSTQGLLVLGPQRIRGNQEYKMVISNFNTQSVNMRVRMEGYRDDGGENLIITKVVNVRGNMNRLVTFELPTLSPGFYKIIVDGSRGINFHKEVELEFISKSISGLIQLDKPVYKPGDSVHFRVIVLDSNLKPPANVTSVNVVIKDSRGNVIRKWSVARLHVGVFEGNLEIAPTPLLGLWNILVKVDDDELVSKPFEVKEYVLASFSIDVSPATTPLEEHQALNLKISAKDMFGKSARGKVDLTLFSTKSLLNVKQTRQVDGVAQLEMRFNRPLVIHDESEDVNLNITFTEHYTNRSISNSLPITVYKTKYTAKLIKETPVFLPGILYKATVKVEHRDGSPAKSVKGRVEVDGLEEPYEKKFQTDGNGETTLELMPSQTDALLITVTVGEHTILEEEISKAQQITEGFVKIYLKSDLQPSRPIKLEVICREKVKFLASYVLSKGHVIYENLKRSESNKFILDLKYSINMVPKAKVLVATVTKNIVVYDIIDIVFPGLQNNFEMKMEDHEVQPGEQIQLEMSGRPGSYVALAAYDKSLLQFGSTHDMYWNDVWQLYDTFHGTDETQFDTFMSNGLFTFISDNLSFMQAERIGRNRNVTNPFPVRTNFAESFLWRNATMDKAGKLTLVENTPDTTTAWCLTGFSMDSVYGLGIIKKPLQLNTNKDFYIVDHLPYSIKRGEIVTLKFTVFNNLGADYITEVMVINVQDQMEFVEEPSSKLNFSKVLTVKETVGVPVSFLVKAKKLGEMVVRVKASQMLNSDAIEKVIRVLPESLVETGMDTRLFSSTIQSNKTFELSTQINKKADAGTIKISFSVEPNLLSVVMDNLEKLIDVPIGSGESNMINFVPHVAVLDFLTVINPSHPEFEATKKILRKGYQNQLKYRLVDGSFQDFEGTKSSIFLTAFVAKSMQTAATYLPEVDEKMVNQAYEWLATKQHSSGRFEEEGLILLQHLQTNARKSIGLTSYVLIAFLENSDAKATHSSVIEKGIDYVSNHIKDIEDSFDLAIATYALSLHNSGSDITARLRETLIRKSKVDVDKQEIHWPRQTHSIETTAYALLAIVQAEDLLHNGILIMRWLVNQRSVTGSFPRTQDTFIGLQALAKLVDIIKPERNAYAIKLKIQKKSGGVPISHDFRIDSHDIHTKSFADIPSDTNNVTFSVGGRGFGFISLKYEYRLDLTNYNHRFSLTLVKEQDSRNQLDLKICANFLPNTADERSSKTLVEVNFPSGYVVDNEPISKVTGGKPIHRDIRFGSTSVVVYYESMGTEKNCFVVTAYRRFKVNMRRPAYVVVHDFYNPKYNAIQIYSTVEDAK